MLDGSKWSLGVPIRKLNSIAKLKYEVKIPQCSVLGNIKPQTSNLKPQTSDLKPQTSNLRPQTSDLRPQTSDQCNSIKHKQKATKSLRNWGVPQSPNENSTPKLENPMTQNNRVMTNKPQFRTKIRQIRTLSLQFKTNKSHFRTKLEECMTN